MGWKYLLLAFATFSEAVPLAKRTLDCREITIPISISAQNKNLPSNLTYESLQNYTNFFQTVEAASPGSTAGSYNIAARYCPPTVNIASRSKTLQFLVHGITYSKDYWSGLAAPGTKAGQDQYSWLVYAANEGYPTLSIDRLCNGNSSHPNGLLECQIPSQTETVHAVAQLARGGKIPSVNIAFNKIIYVGHSYGSAVGSDLSVQYPADIDGYILSGYTLNSSNAGAATLLKPAFLPASVALPSRFGFLGGDLTYLTATSKSGIQQLFYYGNYDQNVLQYDFDNRGTVTIGEVGVGSQRGALPAPNYTGPLFVLNGNEDLVFCSEGQLQALANVTANCANGFSSRVKNNYPAVSKFGYYNTPDTGHCLNTHRSAPQSYKAAHDFLASVGF